MVTSITTGGGDGNSFFPWSCQTTKFWPSLDLDILQNTSCLWKKMFWVRKCFIRSIRNASYHNTDKEVWNSQYNWAENFKYEAVNISLGGGGVGGGNQKDLLPCHTLPFSKPSDPFLSLLTLKYKGFPNLTSLQAQCFYIPLSTSSGGLSEEHSAPGIVRAI